MPAFHLDYLYLYVSMYTTHACNYIAMKQSLLVKVKGFVTLFDEVPPLDPAPLNAPREYWLVCGSTTVHRIYYSKNIIEDLYQVLAQEPFYGMPTIQNWAQPQIEVHLTPHDEQELAAEATCTKEVRRFHKSAWCHYDLAAGRLVELYPVESVCAKSLGVGVHSVHACNWGNTAVISGNIVTTSHYLTDEELDLRRVTTARLGGGTTVRVYAYDYNGDPVGVFATIADTAHELQIDYRNVRRGLMNPGKLQQGYYFYADPDRRPPVNPENLL